MKTLAKENWLILGLYAALLGIAGYFLLSYGKVQIHAEINQLVGNTFFDKFFYYITYLGDGNIAIVLLLLILMYNTRLGICCLISFLLAALITSSIKFGLYNDAMRPAFVFDWYTTIKLKFVEGSERLVQLSFPSGHSTQAFAIFICLALFAKKHGVKFLWLFVALLTAFSRVYLSMHWLVDITVGSIIGSASAMLLFYMVVYKNRFRKFNKPLFKLRSS